MGVSLLFPEHDAALLPSLVPFASLYKPLSMPVFNKQKKGQGQGAAKPSSPQPPAPPAGKNQPASKARRCVRDTDSGAVLMPCDLSPLVLQEDKKDKGAAKDKGQAKEPKAGGWMAGVVFGLRIVTTDTWLGLQRRLAVVGRAGRARRRIRRRRKRAKSPRPRPQGEGASQRREQVRHPAVPRCFNYRDEKFDYDGGGSWQLEETMRTLTTWTFASGVSSRCVLEVPLRGLCMPSNATPTTLPAGLEAP
jgi:hypothetical protein